MFTSRAISAVAELLVSAGIRNQVKVKSVLITVNRVIEYGREHLDICPWHRAPGMMPTQQIVDGLPLSMKHK